MSKPDGSQKNPTCTTCGQPLPPEPVYVGPGDVVTSQRERYEIIGISKPGTVWALRLDNRWPVTLSPIEMYRTPDGRPVAGFKDQRDEHIDKLQQDIDERNVKIANLQTHLHHANKRIDELEAQPITRPANPLAGLTDEQLKAISLRQYADFSDGEGCGAETPVFFALRNMRDGKLEVPR